MTTTRVRCYRNLVRKCWSVKAAGRPVEHWASVVLQDVKFVVWQGGRKRVLKEKRKNVHAFATGVLVCGIRDSNRGPVLVGRSTDRPTRRGRFQVSYDPYKAGHFYRLDTNEKVEAVGLLVLRDDGQVFGWERNKHKQEREL